MTPSHDRLIEGGPEIRNRLEAFVAGQSDGDTPLPWADQLSLQDRKRLRDELAMVLSEPEVTGEPLDWQEIDHILREWAEAAGWSGALVQEALLPGKGTYSVEFRPRDARALATASFAVQDAVQTLLTDFLTLHPTAGQRLPRGRLKKMKNRDVWQIELPDGYRLRYFVDERERAVHVTYLGPHPDHDTRGREQAVRAKANREVFGDP